MDFEKTGQHALSKLLRKAWLFQAKNVVFTLWKTLWISSVFSGVFHEFSKEVLHRLWETLWTVRSKKGKNRVNQGIFGFCLDKIDFRRCGQVPFGTILCGKQFSTKKVEKLVEKSQNDESTS